MRASRLLLFAVECSEQNVHVTTSWDEETVKVRRGHTCIQHRVPQNLDFLLVPGFEIFGRKSRDFPGSRDKPFNPTSPLAIVDFRLNFKCLYSLSVHSTLRTCTLIHLKRKICKMKYFYKVQNGIFSDFWTISYDFCFKKPKSA